MNVFIFEVSPDLVRSLNQLTLRGQSWRLYFEGMDGDQAMDENMFNKPTIVLSSGNLKNTSSVGMVSVLVCARKLSAKFRHFLFSLLTTKIILSRGIQHAVCC